jgi:hypothetical protein
MTAYMTTTNDPDTEQLADTLAQTYYAAVWAQVGDYLPPRRRGVQGCLVPRGRARERTRKGAAMTAGELLDLLIAELDQLRADNRRLNLDLAAARSQRDSCSSASPLVGVTGRSDVD